MVDYRGPLVLLPFVDAFGIEAFDRITQVKYRAPYGTGVSISSEALSQIEHLEKISVLGTPGAQAVEEFQVSVPPCRLETVTSAEDSATAKISTGTLAVGCARDSE